MFIEVNAKNVNVNWTINVRAIAFFYPLPLQDGTRIYFINDDEPLEINESYSEFKEKVKRALSEYKEE